MKTSEIALARLRANGMDLPERPDFELPLIPTDLTTLPDADLMALFAELTAWTDHLRGQAALAAVDEKQASRSVDAAEGAALLGAWQAKTPVTVAKTSVDVDPDVAVARDSHAEAEAYRRLVDSLADSTERDMALVSRELTRRTSNAQPRASRWMA